MVPRERIELSRCYQRGILNPVRLPIPPSRHDQWWLILPENKIDEY